MTGIAIIGFQGRFPGNATCPDQFFQDLLAGKVVCGDVPADRWSNARHAVTRPSAGKMSVARGAFLDDACRGIDTDVFALSADEAASLDPQQRLILEVAWEALERAAIDPRALAGEAVGVYVGGFTTDHLLNQFAAAARGDLGRFAATGSTLTMLANRLSHMLDLRGPSIALDTACASSLTALALAVGDLRAGTCDMALVGGVGFMLRPEYPIAMSAAGLLAFDGRSKPFSHLADGYGRGEGCGMLVLKPLAAARTDGDRIAATIEAVGTGHGGRTTGITLPSGTAQVDLLRRTLARSGRSAGDIGYVEAHGTGTRQGDRIEARSIGDVYGGPARDAPLPIGSLKANIGHLEAAAGVAGVIKALLILASGTIPPHPLPGMPDPDIPFDALNLRLPRTAEPLRAPCVAVNAFGYGGSNAHVILGPAPPPDRVVRPAPAACGAVLLPLSAPSIETLAAWVGPAADRIATGLATRDVRHTLVRRGHRACRAALWVDAAAAAATLAARVRHALADGGAVRGENRFGDMPHVAFVFSGMGAQRPAMGQALLADEPVFRTAIEEVDACFGRWSKASLVDAMRAGTAGAGPLSQPLHFALQVGLVRLLRAHGLDPDLCLGHSAGEVAAAWCAGHLDLADAVRVCHLRSMLQEARRGGGGMLVAAIARDRAEALCDAVAGLEVAAINAARQIAFAGPDTALAAAVERLHGVAHRRIPGSIAYHSADMDPILAPLVRQLAGIVPARPTIPLISSVDARPVAAGGDGAMDAAYWARNVRAPVRFHAAIAAALRRGVTHCIEIGAKPVLARAVAATAAELGRAVHVVPALAHDRGEPEAVRDAVARAYVTGAAIDWDRAAPGGTIVDLPVTGWFRRHHWREAPVQAADRAGNGSDDPWAQPSGMPRTSIVDLNREALAFLADHRVHGVSILPGAAALHAACYAGAGGPDAPVALRDIRFETAFALDRTTGQRLDLRHVDGGVELLAYDPARPDGAVRVLAARAGPAGSPPAPVPPAERAAAMPHALDPDRHAARLAALGFDHGPAFRVVRQLSLSADGAAVLALLALDGDRDPAVCATSCLIDGVFQAALALTTDPEPSVPVAIDAFERFAPLPGRVWASVVRHDAGTIDAEMFDAAGRCLARLRGIRVRPLVPRGDRPTLPDMMLATRWHAVSAPVAATAARRVAIVADADHVRDTLAAALRARGTVVADAMPDATICVLSHVPRAPADTLYDLLERCRTPRNGRVYVVTDRAQPVAAGEAVDPDRASAWGMGRTLFNEVADTATTLIDCDIAGDPAWAAQVADEVAADRPNGEIAFRNGRRHLPRMERIGAGQGAAAAPSFRRDAAYLITGGLGGLGRQLACWLARHGSGAIVVTSRTRPAVADVAPLRRALAERGTDLSIATVDLSDAAAVDRLVRDLPAGRPLAGIFHWAGATRDGPAATMSAEAVRTVFAAKADGARHLDAASRALPLDWFVMASSLSAVVGNRHQANYAAANAFLDGVAWSRRAAGLPALSVDFGAVAGTGMAAAPGIAAYLHAAGLPPMPVAEALDGLGAAMLSGRAQVALCRAIDAVRWSRHDPRAAATDRMAGLMAEARRDDPAAGAAAFAWRDTPADAWPGLVAERLRAALGQVLRRSMDRVPLDTPLSHTGLDSLAATEFRLAIECDLGVAIPASALVGGQSLLWLAAQVIDRHEATDAVGSCHGVGGSRGMDHA